MLGRNFISDVIPHAKARPNARAAEAPAPLGLEPASPASPAPAPAAGAPHLADAPFARAPVRRPDTNTPAMLYAFAEKARELGLIDDDTLHARETGSIQRAHVELADAVLEGACERCGAAEGTSEEGARFVERRVAAYLNELIKRMHFELHLPPARLQAAILHALLDLEGEHRAAEREIELRLFDRSRAQ